MHMKYELRVSRVCFLRRPPPDFLGPLGGGVVRCSVESFYSRTCPASGVFSNENRFEWPARRARAGRIVFNAASNQKNYERSLEGRICGKIDSIRDSVGRPDRGDPLEFLSRPWGR